MKKRFILSLLAIWTCTQTAQAELKLPAVFSDHMVLQADQPIHVWGEAAPGERVSVRFGALQAEAKANDAGDWSVLLKACPASTVPAQLEVHSLSDGWKKTFSDVLVGEVWLASGQSNMNFSFRHLGQQNEVGAQPRNQQLRLFKTPHKVSSELQEDSGGQWEIAQPSSLLNFSAVAYYFASRLQADRQVPVGIIVSAWGGTRVETWTPMEDLKRFPELNETLVEYEQMIGDPYTRARLTAQQEAWGNLGYQDPGNCGFLYGYADPDIDLADWKDVQLPNKIEAILGELKDGAFWFRREVRIPDTWVGQPLVLELGVIDDMDQTYVDGVPVGSTGPGIPGYWMKPRTYTVPDYLVRDHELTLAVRVFDRANQGGFLSPRGALKIYPAGRKQEAAPLAGAWQFKAEYALDDNTVLQRKFNRRWGVPDTPRGPSNLYNAMIEPFIPYALKGVIWYQGESNAHDPELYARLFPAMIEAWRRKWNMPQLPFLYVELAAYRAAQTEPSETSGWAWQREAQRAALKLPKTALATAIDVGDATDIHPKNKKAVGERLALAAGGLVYGESGLWQSPMYANSELENGKVRISFSFADGGLELSEGDAPQSFAICGEDRIWHWAKARISGEQILVWSPEVPNPVAVRYAWANNPKINVYNKAGLPLLPFRTDQFE